MPDGRAQRGAWGVAALWLRVLPDACSTALSEHIVALKERRAVAQVELAAVGAQGEYAMRRIVSRSVASAISAAALLERVRVQMWPANAEVSTRSLQIRQDGVASPDGRWAAVVAKHIYGPEDVIVVGLE